MSNQFGRWTPSWTDRWERTALAQNAKHGRRVEWPAAETCINQMFQEE